MKTTPGHDWDTRNRRKMVGVFLEDRRIGRDQLSVPPLKSRQTVYRDPGESDGWWLASISEKARKGLERRGQ